MITDVYFIYNNEEQIRRIGGTLKVSPFFHFIDDRTHSGRKEAFKLKNYWGAKQTPFIVCMEGEKPIKIFYSESGDDIIMQLNNFLNL